MWPELAAATAAGVLYARTLTFGFVFDDHSLVDEHGPRLLGREWLPYRPLRYASLWLDHQIGGGEAWAYHLSNVLLHAATAVLVVRLSRRAGATGAVALVCALPFVTHPVAVEAVAYVAGRRDLLTAVCGLGALAAWAGTRGMSALAVALVLLAVAAKEVGVLFVALLAAASTCGIGLAPRRAYSPLLLTALAAIALPIAYGAQGPLAPSGGLDTKLAVAGSVAAHYVRNVAAPADLSIEYPKLRCATARCDRLMDAQALAGLTIVFASLIGAAMALARVRTGDAQHAWVALCALWIATWLLALSFVVGTHEPGADRHAYVLLAALAVAAAAIAAHAPVRLRRVAAILLIAWTALLAARANERISVWRNDRMLWASALPTARSSPRVHHNLAAALAEQRRFGRARRHLVRAARLEPSYWPSALGFAAIHCERSRFAAAEVRIAQARAQGASHDQLAAVEERCAELRRRR